MPVLRCPGCRELLQVPNEWQGTSRSCPRCRQPWDIPLPCGEAVPGELHTTRSNIPEGRPDSPDQATRSVTCPVGSSAAPAGNLPARPALVGYELLEEIGQGAMGTVYRARHEKMSRTVAIKIIRSERAGEPDSVRRFRREVRAVAQLDHPNIVRALHADEVDGALYLVMEYVEGIDLARLVREQGPLPIARACEYIRQAALGLQHAYERGLVHRDLKPRNLLLSEPGLIKVLDFGLARLGEPGSSAQSSTMTHSGVVMGTPDYMAPEQGRHSHTVDIRADLYSLGCTLYFLLTGRVPFPGGSLTEKLFRHQHQQPEPLRSLRPDTPPAVTALVSRLMAKWPADRFQTPAELIHALDAVLESFRPAPPERSDPAEESRTITPQPGVPSRPARRKRHILVVALVVAGLLLAGVAAWRGFFATDDPPPADPPDRLVTPGPPREGQPPARALEELPPPNAEQPIEALPGPRIEVAALAGQPAQPKLRHVLRPFNAIHSVRCLSFSADGKSLLVAGHAADATVRLIDPLGGKEQARFKQPALSRRAVLSPDGKRVAAVGFPNRLTLWDRAGGQVVAAVTADSLDLAYSPDGRWLAYGDRKPENPKRPLALLRWRDTTTGKELEPVPIGYWNLEALAFSPDGRYLATLAHSNHIHLYAVGTRERLFQKYTESIPCSVVFSGDGKLLALDGHAGKGKVFLWALSVPDGGERARVPLPVGRVGPFLYGDRVVCWSGDDGLIRFLDTSQWKEALSWQAHDSAVCDCVVSPDGRLLASIDRDGHLKVWELTTQPADDAARR